jgi:hypothetical protein
MFKLLNNHQHQHQQSSLSINNNNNQSKTPAKRLKIIESANNKLSSNIFIINNNKFLKQTAANSSDTQTTLSNPSTNSSSSINVNNVKVKSYFAGKEIDPNKLTKTNTKLDNNNNNNYNYDGDQDDLSTSLISIPIHNEQQLSSSSTKSINDSIEIIGGGIQLEKSNLNRINKYRSGKCVNFKEIVNIYEYPSFESFILSS